MEEIGKMEGALISPQDIRDYSLNIFTSTPKEFPKEYTIPYDPAIKNQLWSKMCTAFSLASIKESQELKERGIQEGYSYKFIYGNRKDRDYMGEGMYPNQALKRLQEDGVPKRTDMRGISSAPDAIAEVKAKSPEIYKLAKPQKIESYVRLQNINEVKTALLEFETPVLISVAIFNGFTANRLNGIITYKTAMITGYHSMIITGWKEINGKEYFEINNSSGDKWGLNGKGFLPTDYLGTREYWCVVDYTPDITEYKMDAPMQVIPPGHTVLPFRSIYESIGGKVDWGKDNDLIWASATLPPRDKPIILKSKNNSNILKIIKTNEGASFVNIKEGIKQMSMAMQITPEGRTILPFRSIYEAIGAKVDWGIDEDGEVWAQATIPPTNQTVKVNTVQNDSVLHIQI